MTAVTFELVLRNDRLKKEDSSLSFGALGNPQQSKKTGTE
jgi:hypothetical protein